MSESVVPPCPEWLIQKMTEPMRFEGTREGARDPGSVWEVVTPDGEVLLILVVKRLEDETAGPFPIVRAIPLSDFVRLTDVGDTIVAVEPGAKILAGHCWLEGPVLPERLVRAIGKATPASMDAVERARAQSITRSSNPAVSSFRESLYEQFDPLFSSSWEKLYTHPDVENRADDAERPNALAMLARRNQEMESHLASVALAANAGEITSPAAEALLHRTWPIVGDPEVEVRLELRAGQSNHRLLVAALVGTVHKMTKYRFVEVVFRSTPAREVPFHLGWASLPLVANDIDEIASLVTVDVDGTRRHVNLEGLSSGT